MTLEILKNSLLILAGLYLLYFGGNYLVKGASALALKFNIAPIVVGLTVVAFGTSAPELFVSLTSALQGSVDISLGNVVGSNTINIALILGLSALIIPIPVSKGIIRRDIPLMFVSYAILFAVVYPMFWDPDAATGVIYRIEGLVMVIALVAYIVFLYTYSKNHQDEVAELVEMDELEKAQGDSSVFVMLLQLAVGIAALRFGSDWLVNGASWLARSVFGASERFIGITIVAFGTSLPELVTSVIAAAKKQMDISVGNIVGSNIFNSLMVLGATSLVVPIEASTQGFAADLIVMLGVSVLLYIIVLLRKKLERWSGLFFLAVYAVYFVTLLQNKSI